MRRAALTAGLVAALATQTLHGSTARSWARATDGRHRRRSDSDVTSGGGGNRTRVRKPSAPRPYVRSPRFGVGRRAGTDTLSSTPSRNSLAVQGPGPPGRPARILTVNPEPTGRDPGDRALGLFKQPARAQRCRWLLCRCLRDLRVSGPLGTRPRASVPPSKPGRPLSAARVTAPAPHSTPCRWFAYQTWQSGDDFSGSSPSWGTRFCE